MMRILCVGVLVVGLSAARADEKKEDPPEVAALKAKLEAQAKEIQALKKKVDQLEDERTKLILEKEVALREALQHKNEAKFARAIAEECEKKIEALNAKILKLRENSPDRPQAPAPKAAPIGAVTRDIIDGLVLINIGIDAGLEVGSRLEVVRINEKKERVFLGTIVITKSLYPKEAVGTFLPASNVPLAKLKPEELPRKGDAVRPVVPVPRE